MRLTSIIRIFIKNVLGLEIYRVQSLPENPFFSRKKNYLVETDPFFNETYNEGLLESGTPEGDVNRRLRFYNLAHLLQQTGGLRGIVAECGCWRGLSSFILCRYLSRFQEGFRGKDYHIIDSFQGLSSPESHDLINDKEVTGAITPRPAQLRGAFAADLEHVRRTLRQYPLVTYHKGWIPAVLGDLPEAVYRFVHLDVDFYGPTRGAIEYFYPRLTDGGILVCDDYGSLSWPGAKKAVDDYCRISDLLPLVLSTGQAILWKRS